MMWLLLIRCTLMSVLAQGAVVDDDVDLVYTEKGCQDAC